MKKFWILALFIFCANIQQAQAGFFYTETTQPVCGTQYRGDERMGMAESHTIMGFVTTGDAGIRAAALNGGIYKINYVDQDIKSVLFFYKKRTTKVYGY